MTIIDYKPLRYRRRMPLNQEQNSLIIPIENQQTWKLNLLASSQLNTNRLYIALDNDIMICDLINYKPVDLVGNQLNQLSSTPNTIFRTGLYDPINALNIGLLGRCEFLMTVDDGGHIRLYNTSNFKLPPISLNNDGISTWGAAICTKAYLVAVSDNSHRIKIWNMTSKGDQFNVGSRKVLSGHHDNIPCINFSTDGTKLVSCSIDKQCIVWDVLNGYAIARFSNREWNWSCLFISIADIKQIAKDNEVWNTDFGSPRSSSAFDNLMEESIINNRMGVDIEIHPESSYEGDQDFAETETIDHPGLRVFDESESDFNTSDNMFDCFDISYDSEHFLSETVLSKKPLSNMENEVNSYLYQESLVILGCQHDISLFDYESHDMLSGFRNMFSGNSAYAHRSAFERLSVLKWIRELSLVIVGCQSGKVGMVRLLKSEEKVKMIVESWIPSTSSTLPILGMSCVKLPNVNIIYQLTIVYLDGTLSVYTITSSCSYTQLI